MAQVPSGPNSQWIKFPVDQVPSGPSGPSGPSSQWPKFPVAQSVVAPVRAAGGKSFKGGQVLKRKSSPFEINQNLRTCLSNQVLEGSKNLERMKVVSSWRPTFKKLKSNPSSGEEVTTSVLTEPQKPVKQFYISSSLLGQVNSSTFRPVCWANKSSGSKFQVGSNFKSQGKNSSIQVSNIKSFDEDVSIEGDQSP